MLDMTRRGLLGSAAVAASVLTIEAARGASFGNPDEPPQGALSTQNPASLTDPGPHSPAIANQFPAAASPPDTDVGDMPQFWASFNNAHKRIQNGGWARQVTQADFQISETIAGVNMRLTAGGLRELHWHTFGEWAYVTYGSCRITVLDPAGHTYVADVNEGDVWFFPPGFPHSLQGLGPDGCEFIIAFDSGQASEFSTLLLTDLMAHMPPDILAQNFNVPADAFAKIPLHDLYIFQSAVPGPLADDQAAVASASRAPTYPFTFSLKGQPIARETPGGTVQILDSRVFHVSSIAASLVTIRPGGLRELHWHPNADEWQYYIKGKAQVGVFSAGPKAVSTNFNAGDVGYVVRNNAHYVKNIGDTDLQFLEVFRSPVFQDISLSDWLTHTPPAMVAAHLNVDAATIAKFPNDKPEILPG